MSSGPTSSSSTTWRPSVIPWTGDYSLAGYEGRVALERKSLDDLIGCLTTGRDRFERELARAKELDFFAVIVEASMEDVAKGRYRSKLPPHAALQSIMAFQVRYGVNFIWAGNRAGGEYTAYWTLEKYQREKEARGEGACASSETGATQVGEGTAQGRAQRAN